MSWLTETVAAPLLGVLLRRAVPMLVAAAMGALAAVELVPAEWAQCVGATQSGLSLSSPTPAQPVSP